jgi:hypothetical protein
MTRKNHFVIKLLLVTVLPVLIMFGLVSAVKYAVAAPDLTGIYKANDGGTYYVRQLGNTVFWLGMSSDDGGTWTNVFKGIITGNKINGNWADVPRGQVHSGGVMNLLILSPNSFKVLSQTGGFGGSLWNRT